MKLLGGLLTTVVSMSVVSCGAPDDTQSDESREQSVQSEQSELSRKTLTTKQASTVLELVDDICGDSWCEGDYNFHFDRIDCSRGHGAASGTCRLDFRIFPYDSDLKTGPTEALSCQTGGFKGFSSLVDTAPNGYQSLNQQYYDALSACIGDLEDQLRPRP